MTTIEKLVAIIAEHDMIEIVDVFAPIPMTMYMEMKNLYYTLLAEVEAGAPMTDHIGDYLDEANLILVSAGIIPQD